MAKYFSQNEFKQPAGFGFPETPYLSDGPWDALSSTLDTIREAVGYPVSPTHQGGYRSVEYNAAMYAAKGQKPTDSQHSRGAAADIQCAHATPDQMHRLVLKLYAAGALPHLGGLGWYDSFIHVDVRPRVPANHLAQWDYRTVKK